MPILEKLGKGHPEGERRYAQLVGTPEELAIELEQLKALGITQETCVGQHALVATEKGRPLYIRLNPDQYNKYKKDEHAYTKLLGMDFFNTHSISLGKLDAEFVQVLISGLTKTGDPVALKKCLQVFINSVKDEHKNKSALDRFSSFAKKSKTDLESLMENFQSFLKNMIHAAKDSKFAQERKAVVSEKDLHVGGVAAPAKEESSAIKLKRVAGEARRHVINEEDHKKHGLHDV
ncbi:MAG: hypothetical protein Q8R79_04640 [Legionellaceae bacterium]|nr:hypothetical protein [Legionellaceae bacterium]